MTPIDILYEDNHLLVINKPNNILVQGDETGDESLLDQGKSYIKSKYKKPGAVYLGLVHRLDRPVSGVVVMSKTSKCLERMNKLFLTRQVNKDYWAIVSTRPPQDQMTLTHYLVKDKVKNRVHVHQKPKSNTKEAVLSFETIGRIGGHYLLNVRLETGRPHQIRAQLAKIGCPIRGDRKYGSTDRVKDNSICLHARSLSFEHPVKKESVSFSANVPKTSSWQPFWQFKP